MKIKTQLECEYPAVGNTALWQFLVRRLSEENLCVGLLDAVGTVCIHGITLSKNIIRFFPMFTLHDETHIVNVCNWMVRLLSKQWDSLSFHEAALLVMAACCHDIGMSVSVNKEKTLDSNPESSEWKRYFKNHYNDEEKFRKTGIISAQMKRNYVRLNHHKLVEENLDELEWPKILLDNRITRSNLIALCQSHGQDLDWLTCQKDLSYDLRFCAVLLRIADILDFDSSRAPATLFKHLGLDNPTDLETRISQTEWVKNRAGVFGEIKNGIIPFTASFTSLQLEYEVRAYLDWVEQELISSGEYLSSLAGKWQNFKLPREVSTDAIERNGYQFGKFCLTLDQDQVLALFTGQNLYGNPGVFVRELLQNALDAVLLRSALQKQFREEDGRIIVRCWSDREGRDWFRIEDNGVGMDENIITEYFLKIGRSYYTSDAFKADTRYYAPGENYVPISRFGIGILSCFMSDPENTLLEVSTKRFFHDRNLEPPAIRLNVTGLHGYYYLAQENAQNENSKFFKRMHHPEGKDTGYRTEPGTTICVQINLDKMGSYRSFKEILDKYVRFPRIQVEYFGPEGHMVYPTQQRLMDTIHALNPDGRFNPREYFHPIPDEQFSELKKALPNVEWKKPPAFVLQYYPLDWYSATGDVSGATIFVRTELSYEITPLVCNKKHIPVSLKCSFENGAAEKEFLLKFDITCSLEYEKRKHYKKFESQFKEYEKNTIIHIPYSIFISLMNSDEAFMLRYMLGNPPDVTYNETVSYRGILAAIRKTRGPWNKYWVCEYLLDRAAKPDVNLARDSINSLPLETACELALMRRALEIDFLGIDGDLVSWSNKFSTLTEQKLWKLLERYPDWEKLLERIGEKYFIRFHPDVLDTEQPCMNTLGQLLLPTKTIRKDPEWLTIQRVDINSLCHWLYVAAAKKNTNFYKEGPDTSEFPVMLFCMRPEPGAPLGWITFIRSLNINYFNSYHRFSYWLIQHREALQARVPSLYDRLINEMLLMYRKVDIKNAINGILVQLRKMDGNPFDIEDTLFLTDSDLLEQDFSE